MGNRDNRVILYCVLFIEYDHVGASVQADKKTHYMVLDSAAKIPTKQDEGSVEI